MSTVILEEPKPKRLKFRKYEKQDFYPVVKQRVHEYFQKTGASHHGSHRLYLKGFILTALYLSLYIAIMSNTFQLLGLIVLFGLLGITKGLIGFNIIHDALHGSYTSNPKINRALGYWFDFNGTSSYIWKLAHNVQHHTYTNIPGHDEDIDKAILLRLNTSDKLYWFHRYQNWYAPLLYSVVTLNWTFYSDYAWFIKESKTKKVPAKEIILFVSLKLLNLFAFLVLPILVLSVPWWYVALGFISMHVCAGVMLSIVFQLAHIVDNVQYFEPDAEGNMQNNWAIHEMLTTSNFATNNKLLTELVGGLNFQVEHHLFPSISHNHYPKIQEIVKATAKEFNIPYFEQPTFSAALRSHFRTLKRLGRGG